jgi:hypothetical protein
MAAQPSIFVSYAHTDTKYLRELDAQLRALELYAKVEPFDDRKLLGGDAWDTEVQAALNRADIILLLVTANFIGSRYIHRVELPKALKRREENGAVVVPVLLEDCARWLLGIDDINYLPKDPNGALKPLSEWRGTQKPRALTQVTKHVHAQIERLRARAEQEVEVAAESGIDLTLYRRRAQQKWAAVDLSALAAPGAVDADITIRLADVFVPQMARRSRPPVSLPRDYLKGQGFDPEAEAARLKEIADTWERLTPVPALELVAECPQGHLVLLGDPGAGKSALARYVLLQLLTDVASSGSYLAALAGHVPFLIELRDFVLRELEGHCDDLPGYLAYCGRELVFGFDLKSLEQQLAQRPSLIVIDGLDEIFDARRRRLMVDQIIGLAGRYPKLRLIITSRVAGFDDGPFRAAGFAVATLIDLTREQIEGFATAWFTIVFPADPAAAARARSDLLEAVQRRPQLRAIAGNPMILTIMATVARHRRLGRSRAALYAQALELLCYNWDYRRGLGLPADSPLIDLQAEDTLLMLRRIAWRMQEFPDGLRANAIGDTSLRGVIEDFFRGDWRFDTPKARRAASQMLQRLEERNWVVTLRGPALYGFVHRTFLEYLCALELSERFKAQQLDVDSLVSNYVSPRLADDTWHEILPLLLGLLPPLVAEQMISAILPGESGVADSLPRFILGWQGLSEIEPRHIPTLGNVCNQLTKLLYAWLPSYSQGASLGPGFDIADAVRSIGQVAWPIPHPPETAWPARAADDTHNYLNLMAVLGKTVWDCPAAAEKLIVTSCRNRNPFLRSAALVILGIHFPQSTNHFRIAHTLVSKDPHRFVRQTALTELAEYFHEALDTKAVLLARAIEDSDQQCRGIATDLLVKYLREDPDTKRLLHTRAIEDPDASVRGTAFLQLARILNVPGLETLASRGLDGNPPGRDPRDPITEEDVRRAAETLNEAEETVLALYRRLAEEVPLNFATGIPDGTAGPIIRPRAARPSRSVARSPRVPPRRRAPPGGR